MNPFDGGCTPGYAHLFAADIPTVLSHRLRSSFSLTQRQRHIEFFAAVQKGHNTRTHTLKYEQHILDTPFNNSIALHQMFSRRFVPKAMPLTCRRQLLGCERVTAFSSLSLQHRYFSHTATIFSPTEGAQPSQAAANAAGPASASASQRSTPPTVENSTAPAAAAAAGGPSSTKPAPPSRADAATSTDLRGNVYAAGLEAEEEAAAEKAAKVSRAAEWRNLVLSSWQRGMFTALGVATGVAMLVFLLAAPMKADTVQQTAQIASQALEDDRLKETATKLSKEVVEQILTDPRSVVLLAEVIQTLLKQDATKIAVTSFIRDIFEDRYTQEVTKKFVLKVVSDPWVMDQLHHILFSLVDDLLKDPETKEALREVLVVSSIEALRDEALQAQGGRAVRSIVWQTIWNSKTSAAGTNTGPEMGGAPPPPPPAAK